MVESLSKDRQKLESSGKGVNILNYYTNKDLLDLLHLVEQEIRRRFNIER